MNGPSLQSREGKLGTRLHILRVRGRGSAARSGRRLAAAGRTRAGARARPSLPKQIVERRLRARELGGVLRDVGAFFRLEVIAEIRLILFAHFLRRRLLAMLRIGRVVLNAHLAHVQLRVTRLTNIEPSERQTERGERSAAPPTE